MSSFTTPLIISYLNDRNWQLEENFIYYTSAGEIFFQSIQVKVPNGFITNFASIPRVFWSILPPTGSYGKAAVIHDYLYATGKFSRWKADRVFREAMQILKVPNWKIFVIYWAVRLFGSLNYNRRKK